MPESTRRRFNHSQRVALYLAADGRCSACGVPLTRGWHADHVQPYVRGGVTDVANGQALCPKCNQRKGVHVPGLDVWPTQLPIRQWQQRALLAWLGCSEANFLAGVTPGAGKTIFALRCAHAALQESPSRRVVVVVNTEHLRRQWKDKAADVGIQLDNAWANEAIETDDFHGIVVTYQAVARQPDLFRMHARQRETLVVLDEVHHAGDGLNWGDNIRVAFEHAWRRLLLSGTPFRHDGNAIPFVKYVDDYSAADFVYTYRDALEDSEQVCRSVIFSSHDGIMEWYSAGDHYQAAFPDAIPDEEAGRRLRTALDPSKHWLADLLREADLELDSVRSTDAPDAGGLVVCVDQRHARAVAELLQRITHESPAIAISEDPSASDKIASYAKSNQRWIVAVRMISEGVDIPRLRVGAYATNVITELFFRQFVGRFVRGEGVASILLPAEETLKAYAQRVTEEVNAALETIETSARERSEPAWWDDPNFFEPVDARDNSRAGVIFDGQEMGSAQWEAVAEAARRAGFSSQEQIRNVIRLMREFGLVVAAPPADTRAEPAADQRKRLRGDRQHWGRTFARLLRPYVSVENPKELYRRVYQRLAERTAWAQPATIAQLLASIDLLKDWSDSLARAKHDGRAQSWVDDWMRGLGS